MAEKSKKIAVLIILSVCVFFGIGSLYIVSKSDNKIDLLGNSAFTGPTFFKLSSQSLTIINPARDFYIGEETSSASADFSVDPGNNIVKVSSNFDFYNEIRPDGATCANGEILKKTAADDWDCATDATGAGTSVASNSLDFDEFVNAFTLDTNQTVASSGFTFNWGETDFTKLGIASVQFVNSSLGTTGSPAYTFTGDRNTGIYLAGADNFGIATGGSARITTSTTQSIFLVNLISNTSRGFQIVTTGVTAAAPSYTFNGDPNTGIYSAVADTLQFTTGGLERFSISTTKASSSLPFEIEGTASASYFISPNALQIANGTSVSYSRFGVNATGHTLAASSDLLISGLSEFDSQAYFDSSASVSGNFEIGDASVFRMMRIHADNAIGTSGIILSDDVENTGFAIHSGGFDGILTDSNGNYTKASGTAEINGTSDGDVHIAQGQNALEGSTVDIGTGFGDVNINNSSLAGRTADTFIGGSVGSDLFVVGMASVALNFEVGGFSSASAFIVEDGTSSLPSIRFSADSDTGIIRGGSNDIRLIAGTGQVSWNADSWYPADDNSKGLGYSTNRWRDLFAVKGSISAAFEIGTYASATQYFGGYASHQFRGTIEGNADDTLSVGTTAKKLHQLVSNLIKAITELIIPNAAGGPTIDKAGEIGVDTGAPASGSFQFHDGVAERALKSYQSKSFTIENPAANENITLWRPGFPITIFRVDHVASDSGTSITWNIAHGADRSAAGTNLFSSGRTTNNNTNGIIEPTFNDATITADEWLSFRTTASTETAGHINVTIFFRYDP